MKYMIGPTPQDIQLRLIEKWDKGYFLKNYKEKFPYVVSLGTVSAKTITDSFEQVRDWIRLYQDTKRISSFIQWEETNHRYVGRTRIPKRLAFETPALLAQFINRSLEWDIFTTSLAQIAAIDERIVSWGEQHPLDLLRIHYDLDRLLSLWQWMYSNPRPNMYVRQIDLPRIDTKFTETYQKILSEWLDLTLDGEYIDCRYTRFEPRYGFKHKPELLRFRILDSTLNWNGCDDISIPADQFCQLYDDNVSIPIQKVFVVENDICALSFPNVPNSIVVFGRGYNFDYLQECAWLHRIKLYYWGDIDTHGFSILNEFRRLFPHTISFLMDRETLVRHEFSWGIEPKPTHNELRYLLPEEASLYDALRCNTIRKNIRLEQEFIRYKDIVSVVTEPL